MDNVVARLMRYAKVWSESDYHANRGTTPSTDRQFDMARLLVEELHGMGVDNAFVDDTCYVYASLPATPGSGTESRAEYCHEGQRLPGTEKVHRPGFGLH